MDPVGGLASGEGQQGRAFYQFSAPYRIRAVATRAAAIRCACDDAIRSFINASTSAGAVSGDPALKGRWIIFQTELDRFGGGAINEFRDHCQLP